MTMAGGRSILGNGTAGYSESGEVAIAEPFGLVIGPDGGLFFCDLGNHRIRCWQDDAVTTVVGNGNAGNDGDGGPAVAASIIEPYELRLDATGQLFFVDMKAHVVRKVDRDGIITTVAGTGQQGFSGDGSAAIDAQLNQPHSIEFGPDGSLYVADIANHRIRRVDLQSGRIETFAGNGHTDATPDGAGLASVALNGPRAIAFDSHGDMILALREGNALHRIDMRDRTIHHIAGNGRFGWEGDGGDARLARLAGPKGIALSQAGDIYLADTESHTIRRIDSVRNVITTVLGNGTENDGPDGDPLTCSLARPHGVHVDASDNVWIGDSDNHRIRVLSH